MKSPFSLINLVLLIASSPISAQIPHAYFDVTDFSNCVIALALEEMGPGKLSLRLNESKALMERIAESESKKSGSVRIYPPLSYVLTPQSFIEAQALHSLPLINFERYQGRESAVHRDLLSRLSDLYRHRDFAAEYDLTSTPNPLTLLDEKVPQDYSNSLINLIDDSESLEYLDSIARVDAEPFITALLGYPKESLSHFEVLQLATRIYSGDVVNALGIIGYVFEQERRFTNNRNRRLILGSRIRPLFASNQIDNLGYNYHFWTYMNASLLGNSALMNGISIIYEGTKGDHGDRAADTLGIMSGVAISQNLNTRPSCPWLR